MNFANNIVNRGQNRQSWIIQFKFICIALFTIQPLQAALQEIKSLQ